MRRPTHFTRTENSRWRRWIVPNLVAAALMAGLLSPLSVATEQAVAAVPPELTETFNGARDEDPSYGLNDSLGTRQGGTARGVTFTRVHGDWSTPASTPPASYTQINNPGFANKLSFWVKNSAVRLDAPVMPDAADSFTVTAIVDPNANSFGAATDWVSLMLANSNSSTGYVTANWAAVGISDSGVDGFLYAAKAGCW